MPRRGQGTKIVRVRTETEQPRGMKRSWVKPTRKENLKKRAAGCVTEDVGSTAAPQTAGPARWGFHFVFAQIRAFRCGGCGGCQW